jgi:hypothetical protein
VVLALRAWKFSLRSTAIPVGSTHERPENSGLSCIRGAAAEYT